MGRAILGLIATLLLPLSSFPARAGEETLRVEGSRPLPAAEQQRIVRLIDALAGLDDWRDGIHPGSGGGCGFSPIDDEREKGTLASRAFRELVALGPEAMPFLLDRLDDATPTKLVIGHEGCFGGMALACELESNPSDAGEVAAIREALPDYGRGEEGESGFDSGAPITKHAVTVGDACFAILGQITNRVYEAVRYQPTACYVVNSPTRTARLARAVRAQWAGKDLRVELARRLHADFQTVPEGSRRADGGDLQTGGLVRLAWYYRAEAVPLVTEYLAGIGREDLERRRDPGRGIRYHRLFLYLARFDVPEVRAALAPLIWKTADPSIVASLLDAVPDDRSPELFDHLKAVIRANVVHSGHFQWLLAVVRLRWPHRLREVLLWHYAEHGGLAVQDLVEFCYEDDVRLPLAVWATLLGQTRKAVPWQRGDPHPLERLRVCDVAALAIARQRPDLAFDETADVPSRDAALDRMREALEKEGIK